MSYRFLEDIATADVAFEVDGATREELFASATEALLAVMTAEPERVGRREMVTIRVEQTALDLLLYDFLGEMVYLKDARHLLLHVDRLQIDGHGGTLILTGELNGERIDPSRHRLLVDVKAVTIHRLRATFEDGVWRATVVLDV